MHSSSQGVFCRRGQTSSNYLLLIVGLTLGVVALVWFFRPSDTLEMVSQDNLANSKEDTRLALKAPPIPVGWSEVGGVARPATDVAEKRNNSNPLLDNLPKKPHGFSPPVDPNTNEQTRQVHAALKDRTDPSVFSSFAEPKPFDAKKYAENPDEYLNSQEPGRVFAPAEPAEGIKPIRVVDKRYFRVVQGESVRLSVLVDPGAPVTFTSQSLGYFENKLTSQTVRADEQGLASADFTVGGGTIDTIQILAAGPMNSGQVTFNVNVSLSASSDSSAGR